MIKEVLKILRCIFRHIIMRFNGCRFKSIGLRSYVKKPIRVVNSHNVIIGNETYILDGMRLETHEKWNEQLFHPQVVIGDRVTFGQFTHLVCASSIIIHDDVSIGPFTMINDCSHGYEDPDMPLGIQDLKTAPIEIGEGTIIGMSVCILPGVKIGRHCYIGANTVISKDIPDNTIVSSQNPRKVVIPY